MTQHREKSESKKCPKTPRMTCVQSLALVHGDSWGGYIVFEQAWGYIRRDRPLWTHRRWKTGVISTAGGCHARSCNISPPHPHSSFFPLPPLKPAPLHKRNTPLNICVCVCMCACAIVLFPQSLHGWVVAAAPLPATGSSSGSPSF